MGGREPPSFRRGIGGKPGIGAPARMRGGGLEGRMEGIDGYGIGCGSLAKSFLTLRKGFGLAKVSVLFTLVMEISGGMS